MLGEEITKNELTIYEIQIFRKNEEAFREGVIPALVFYGIDCCVTHLYDWFIIEQEFGAGLR